MQGSSSDTDDDVSVADATDVAVIARDSRKSRQKNGKNHGKLLWKSQKSRQKHGIKLRAQRPFMQSIGLTVIDDHHGIIICSARFSSVKFCRCGALTDSRKI